MKRIAVYCGASIGNDSAYQQAAIELENYLAQHDLELGFWCKVLVASVIW